jgi:transposase
MAQSIIHSCFEQLGISEWENHLKSWRRSRLSKAEYCRRKNISYHAFNYWKRKFEKQRSPSPITLVKLEEPKEVTSSFQKRTETSQSPIRFWVKDFCIEVENNFSPAVLTQLVQTLRRI